MKKVIKGKTYNTETAKVIANCGYGFKAEGEHFTRETLYIKKDGSLFIHHEDQNGEHIRTTDYIEAVCWIYGNFSFRIIEEWNESTKYDFFWSEEMTNELKVATGNNPHGCEVGTVVRYSPNWRTKSEENCRMIITENHFGSEDRCKVQHLVHQNTFGHTEVVDYKMIQEV